MVTNSRLNLPLKESKHSKAYFAEEQKGWHGYIEWEKYAEKKKKAADILAQYAFAGEPEFQLTPLPSTNPILEGVRWKQYHAALGPTFENMPEESWDIVKEEKAEDMIHVLDFPYNGETPRDRLIESVFTRNEDHFVRNHGGIPIINEDDYSLEISGMKGNVYNYVVSVPWRKVRMHEVMLAWEMNGKPLPKIHGAPLRVVVFGYIGARSVKWLARINAIAEPSTTPVQKKEYLYYTPQGGKHNATYSNGFSIQDMPVSSAIISPIEKAVVIHDGKIKMRGWAYSGGGHWPERVEVSGDGGSVWYETPYEKLSKKYFHAWRLWEVDLPVDAEGWLELVVRCWDNSLNTQPTFVRSAWNWDLHVTSSCHRIKVFSVNKSHPATAKRMAQLEQKGIDFLPITKPLPVDLEEDDEYETEMQRRHGRDPEE